MTDAVILVGGLGKRLGKSQKKYQTINKIERNF